jgi:hypothetical protein
MRAIARIVHLLLCAFLVSAALSQTLQPQQLPQAQPGAAYNAQLSIPPGLGYPFTCRLSGDPLPKGLGFDCDRLQLKGRAPAGVDKTYNVTLQLEDAQGNTKSFPLMLRISSKPELVDLSNLQQGSQLPSKVEALATNVDTKTTYDARPPSISPISAAPNGKPAESLPPHNIQASTTPTAQSSGFAGGNDSEGAVRLRNAAAQIRRSTRAAAAPIIRPATNMDAASATDASVPTSSTAILITDQKAVTVSLTLTNADNAGPISSGSDLQECTPVTFNVKVLDAQSEPVKSGSLQVTDSTDENSSNPSVPADPFSITLSKGSGKTTISNLSPGSHKFMATFVQTTQYDNASTGPFDLTIEKAAQPSPTCIYRMPPLFSAVVGLNVEGASSTSPGATFLGNALVDLPVLPKRPMDDRIRNIDNARLFITGSLRIAGMAQPGALSGAQFTTGYLATAINATPDKVVQSWEGVSSVSYRLWSTNLGMGSFSTGTVPSPTYPRNTLITTSVLLSGGFNSPLSASQANPAVFYATNQIQGLFTPKGGWPATCAYNSGTPPCYVSFIPGDRLRFYRHYEAGLRFRIYGEDFDRHILRFPGMVDITAGQNEYVTAGKLNGAVVHIGGFLPIPIPKVPGIYSFGALDSAVNGPVGGGAQLLLAPVPSTANVTYLSTNVYDIPVSQPNRDRYRFGFGIDLYQLLSNAAQKTKPTAPTNP